jgi:hypothetical protein
VNGRDMKVNPTATYAITTKDTIGAEWFGVPIPPGQVISKEEYDNLYNAFGGVNGDPGGAAILLYLGIERVWGGMHYVYVCNSAGNTSGAQYLDRGVSGNQLPENFLTPGRRNFNLRDTVFELNYGGSVPGSQYYFKFGGDEGHFLGKDGKKYPYYECGPYDEGAWLREKFNQFVGMSIVDGTNGENIITRKHTKMQLFNNVMYAHIPMLPSDPELQKYWLSSDVTYKIRVTRPYLRYASRWYETPELRDTDCPVNDEYAEYREQYKGFPVYKLSTRALAPTFSDATLYQSILDNINIVPNPYYGTSLYERNALETIVKITNLPTDLKNNAPVTINIYTVSGILVRTLTKGDSETTYVNWDLKNYANIPVASGVYIIHVNCPGIGERMLKFFCTMRQPNLNAF